MKRHLLVFLCGILLPIAAFGAREGTPVYYANQANNANKANSGYYQNQGYTNYVGQSGQKQILGSSNYSYQVPRPRVPKIEGTMTPNGVALPADQESATNLYASYARRNADFRFKTGVNSILEWDDMILNEVTVGAQHNFNLRNFDMFVYGEYTYGSLESGGWSVDYDLEPYDHSAPQQGIFTISVGDMSGDTNHMRFGVGAKHVWDIGGWKLSPSVGYEIFKHNLQMSNHIYPNPGIYLPLMTDYGDYVFEDGNGKYYSVPQGMETPSDWKQVCMSPEDIMVVSVGSSGLYDLGSDMTTAPYNPSMDDVPWGVTSGDCIIIGGDGMIKIDGTTHIYNTTWSGFYIGLEIEKQMTLVDKLRFYVQFGMPKYSSAGTWPNRTDWQQNPSFIDEGSTGGYSYRAEMEYNYKISDRLRLVLKADTHYFHIGQIPGELYIASQTQWKIDELGQYILDDNGLPILETIPAYTEYISESLKNAFWQSFGLHLGVKYSF
ncbi:MAG: hypothetical protein LBF28_01365 [Rickettsiales bacterium]|jgi:hypothetical protein|nr:hypothetical protein [Rickettsiales bacterium]